MQSLEGVGLSLEEAAGKSSENQRKSVAASPSLVTGFPLGFSFFWMGRTSEIGLAHSFRVISVPPYLSDKINIYQIR